MVDADLQDPSREESTAQISTRALQANARVAKCRAWQAQKDALLSQQKAELDQLAEWGSAMTQMKQFVWAAKKSKLLFQQQRELERLRGR